MATRAITAEEYTDIITVMQQGAPGTPFRKNPRIAAALMVEANTGLRIGDIVIRDNDKEKISGLRLSDIIREAGRYRLNVTEQKTGKPRHFTIPAELYVYLRDYADAEGIEKTEQLFPVTVRAVQKALAAVCDYLELENVSTHSFRKFFATEIYQNNGHDIALVQHLLQHSSAAVTQRYIGIEQDRIEEALTSHCKLI